MRGRARRPLHAVSLAPFSAVADTVPGGRLVSTIGMRRVLDVDAERGRVAVEPGITFAELGAALAAQNLALANYASLPHISVAGAMATSSHGSGAGNGILASMVLEYDIVDSTGRVRTHSLIDAREEDTSGSNGTRAPDKDEFHAGLVSLGAAGIISRLVLQAVPQFKIKQCPYPSVPVSAMLDDVKAFFSLGYSVSGFTDWKSQDTLTSVWIKSVVGREGRVGLPVENSTAGRPCSTRFPDLTQRAAHPWAYHAPT